LVCEKDTGEDGEESDCEPPSHWISEEVYLLTDVLFGPEGDASEQEWPGNWLRSVWMGGS